jgi:hypothetical protein
MGLEKLARFEVFTVVKIQVKVFWVVKTCSVVVGYQGPPKQWYLIAMLQGITTQKNAT